MEKLFGSLSHQKILYNKLDETIARELMLRSWDLATVPFCSLCEGTNFLLSPGTFFETKLFDTSTRCEKGVENEMQKHECDGKIFLTNNLTFFELKNTLRLFANVLR